MNLATKPDSALEYAAADCRLAIIAYPDGHKAPAYMALMNACRAELRRRDGIRTVRRIASEAPPDRLTVPLSDRRHYHENAYFRQQDRQHARDAEHWLSLIRRGI